MKDLTGKKQELNGCMGCEILNGILKPFGGVLYRDEFFYVAQDFELPINGFIIISSVRHVEKLTELNDEERENLIKLINKILNALRKSGVCEEYNVIWEEKPECHFHVWLMPRHKWMIEKFGKVIKSIKPIFDYAFDNLRTEDNFEQILKTCEMLKKELNK